MKSLLTDGITTPLFKATVLGKYTIEYYRCDTTGFIHTESPYWLNEAYTDAITSLDVGLVRRNIEHATRTIDLIKKLKLPADHLVDFGGGYGMFTRLMRDAGYPFLHFDPSCKNLFAAGFESDFGHDEHVARQDLLTAWEVLEHLPNPIESIRQMTGKSDRVLFSTILVPDRPLHDVTDWWYFTPETGQHISFYTIDSLRYIAKKLGVHLYTDGTSLHLFTHRPLANHPFQRSIGKRLFQRLLMRSEDSDTHQNRKNSLLEADFQASLTRLRTLQEAIRRCNDSS